MRVLVTGSRDWTNRRLVHVALHAEVVEKHWPKGYDSDNVFVDWVRPNDFMLVHGACPTGADAVADDWCIGWDFIAERHPANWNEFGKRAGFIRNAEMVASGIDLCLAFIKDKSRGATNCAERAERRGIPTIRYTE